MGRNPPRQAMFPVATVTFYGPANGVSTKVAVGVIPREGGPVAEMRKWYGDSVRDDPVLVAEVKAFVDAKAVRTMLVTRSNFGCPHEEGEDFPDGAQCPLCPDWHGLQGSGAPRGDRRPRDVVVASPRALASGRFP